MKSNKQIIKEDIDVITQGRVLEIIEWGLKNVWFDPEFILSMSTQKVFSAGQRDAINNIYVKFVEGK